MGLSAGDRVEVREGPFTDFLGIVASVESESEKAVVAMQFFGRYVPVKLAIDAVGLTRQENPNRGK
ncbi:MAG TPA: KOW motif-containing protein [Dehalococcoidia bacterium]|nr:KOW motif-containing protein [Dehalococcoidia bacterium]